MEDCTTWEENIYWKHFNTYHFTLVLSPQFNDHLVLPKKFAQHMKPELPDKVFLKGPSGARWEVQLSKTDDLSFVGSEWNDFVQAHELKEYCRLMFKFTRNSTFEVLIFEQESSCEKEVSYFVRRQSKSDHEDQRKRTKGDDDIEVSEDGSEEDSTHVVAKKSRRDAGAEVCAGRKGKKQTIRKRPYSAPSRGRPRKVQVSRRLRCKPAVVSGKGSFINEMVKEPSPVLQRDVITPENGGSLPKNNCAQKLGTRSKNNLTRNDVAKEIVSQVTRELLTPENGDNSEAVYHAHQMENQSEKHPNGNHSVKACSQVSRRGLISPLSGESNRASDSPDELRAQSEKQPSGNGIAKELTQITGRNVITPNYRESSPEEAHFPKSVGNRGRPKKQVLSNSSKKLGIIRGKLPKEYTSNRRPVTEQEKGEAFQKATKSETAHSFTVILPQSSVYKRFFLSVPRKWLQEHLSHQNQEIVLHVGDKTWSTTLFYQGQRGGGISTGWKKFALDNNLEESDVVVFKLSSPKDVTPVIMDVEIFRVVDATVPPSPVVL